MSGIANNKTCQHVVDNSPACTHPIYANNLCIFHHFDIRKKAADFDLAFEKLLMKIERNENYKDYKFSNFIFPEINWRNKKFKKHVIFEDCNFCGDIRLLGSQFLNGITIVRCIFKYLLSMSQCRFGNKAIFQECTFDSTLDLSHAIFSCPTSFKNNIQKSNSTFENTKFENKTTFENDVWCNAQLKNASFLDATIIYNCTIDIIGFDSSSFLGDMSFENNNFKNLSLSQVQFQHFTIRNCRINSKFNCLSMAGQELNLDECILNKGGGIYDCKIDNLSLKPNTGSVFEIQNLSSNTINNSPKINFLKTIDKIHLINCDLRHANFLNSNIRNIYISGSQFFKDHSTKKSISKLYQHDDILKNYNNSNKNEGYKAEMQTLLQKYVELASAIEKSEQLSKSTYNNVVNNNDASASEIISHFHYQALSIKKSLSHGIDKVILNLHSQLTDFNQKKSRVMWIIVIWNLIALPFMLSAIASTITKSTSFMASGWVATIGFFIPNNVLEKVNLIDNMTRLLEIFSFSQASKILYISIILTNYISLIIIIFLYIILSNSFSLKKISHDISFYNNKDKEKKIISLKQKRSKNHL